jgi:regulator of protease activity HflC (stomatin/prohibitin superfamily)
MQDIITAFWVIAILFVLFSGFVTVQQGFVSVITMFGKYRRIMTPGLHFKIPLLENVHRKISIQNRSVELEFQAITQDQANVNFKAMLLFAVMDTQEETIKNVAFKFIDEKNLMQALIRTIEGAIRSYVGNLKQADILVLRSDIVIHVKLQLDATLASWGYHLIDMQLNDITFDAAIMASMAKVVAANNLKSAAENEGQALLITKTKAAEAEGNAIRITAEAERLAAQLRGQGVALFRQEVAKGILQAAKEMQTINADLSVIMFSMWTEAIKNFAEAGHGNVIFLDGSADGMKRTFQQLMAFSQKNLMNIQPEEGQKP